MKQLEKHIKLLLSLLTFCLWVVQAEAQQKVKNIHSAKSFQQSNATVANGNYTVSIKPEGLTLYNGGNKTIICKDGKIESPIVNGNLVYYIKNGNSIRIYDIKSKTEKDLVNTSNAGAEYSTDNKIAKMLIEPKSNRVYFSTFRNGKNGQKEMLCWHYDISSGTLTLYRDGSLESVDADGNQTIAFEGKDARGSYISKTLVSPDGKIINTLGKTYNSLNSK
jgi:uncharacterized protein (DUF2147 family)